MPISLVLLSFSFSVYYSRQFYYPLYNNIIGRIIFIYPSHFFITEHLHKDVVWDKNEKFLISKANFSKNCGPFVYPFERGCDHKWIWLSLHASLCIDSALFLLQLCISNFLCWLLFFSINLFHSLLPTPILNNILIIITIVLFLSHLPFIDYLFYMLPFFNCFLSHFTPRVFYLFLFIDIFIVFILQTSVILSLLLSTIVIYYPFIAFVLAIIVINFPFSLTNQMIKLVNSIRFSGQDLYYFVLVKHQNKYEVFHKSFG